MPPYAEPQEQQGRREILQALGIVFFAYILSVLPPGAQGWIGAGLRVSVLAPFIWVQESLAEARVQATAASLLQGRLDSLTAEVTANRAVVEENRRLRALLGLAARPAVDVVPASVVRTGTAGSAGTFMLDVGLADGVRPNAPVIVAEGLVGIVREVADHASIAMDWTNPDFRVSAMTQNGQEYGIVEPQRGVFGELDRMLWSGAPYFGELTEGTAVVTSGRGGLYPRGIPVGTIDGQAQVDEGWRRSYWVRPVVDAGSVTHVLVVLWGGGATGGPNPPDWWRTVGPDAGADPGDLPPPTLAVPDTGGAGR